MTTTWADTKHRAINAFRGELPNATTEQQILDAFQLEPIAVLHTLDAVIEDFRAGKARSGWAIWRTRVATATATPNVTVDTGGRAKQVALTETWIRNTGGYIDTEDELHEAVFGPHGRLYLWNDDEALVTRIHTLWQHERPRFQQAEQESIERQAHQGDTYRRLRKASRAALTREDADQHAARVHAEVERARLAYLATIAPEPDQENAA